MARYPIPIPQPGQPTLEGDNRFIGLNMKLNREKLDPGYIAAHINRRLNFGISSTRKGIASPMHANAGLVGPFFGSGVYSNPNGEEVILVATATHVVKIKSGSLPTIVGLPTGTVIIGPVEFSQQFDKVLMHRLNLLGVPYKPLVWDGVNPAGFVPISVSDPANTELSIMPPVAWSINFGNRAIFPVDRDSLGASDINDYTSYDAALHVFRVNSGTADKIVGAYAYSESALLVAKGHSFDLLINFYGDLGDQFVLAGGAAGNPPPVMQELSTEIGVAARRTGKMLGGSFVFLSALNGVYEINQFTNTSRLSVNPLPLSDPIEPLIRRINWAKVGGAVAAVEGLYYWLAIPIDGSDVNNALVFYNVTTKQWEGYDTWDDQAGIQIDNLLVSDFYGNRRLYAVNNAKGEIYLLNEGTVDQVGQHQQTHAIQDVIETRSYETLGWGATTKRDFKRAEMSISTYNPSIKVTELTERAHDERLLTPHPIQYDHRVYGIWDKADYLRNNANHDFDVPGREDYLVLAGEGIVGRPIEMQREQRHTLAFSVQTRTRYVGYRIENNQGRANVTAVLVESGGTPKGKTNRAA